MAEEPQLGALSNGSVVIIGHGDARSAGRNTIATALSTDHGRSFGPLRKLPGLVQPGCAVGFLIHEDVMHVSRDNNGTIVTDIVSPKIPGKAMDLHDAMNHKRNQAFALRYQLQLRPNAEHGHGATGAATRRNHSDDDGGAR